MTKGKESPPTAKYDALGVSASKAGLHAVLDEAGVADATGLFAKVSPDLAGDDGYHSIIHCDGAGTKSIVPYLYFRETGDRGLFRGLAQDALVMNLDDVYCVGEPQSLLLANAIGRNRGLIDDAVLGVLIGEYRRLVEQLQSLGIPIGMSGGETADCADVVRTLLVDAVIAARIAKDNIIDANTIVPGDVIVGFSSTGKATYEDAENSGIGSNGLTLARHSLLHRDYRTAYPESLDPSADPALAFAGPFRTTDAPDGLGMTIAEALSSPTRTYAPVLRSIYRAFGRDIHGVIHLTGGGQTKMLRFGRGNHYLKDSLFPVPPLFALIQHHGAVSWREMYQVFNMGHRMEIYLAEEHAQKAITLAAAFGIDAQIVGRVEPSADGVNRLSLNSEHGLFEYTLA